MNSSWLRHAVENNARWCEIVCASHGRPGEFFPGAWVNRQDTPPFYPNMVTLSPGHNADQFDQIRQLIDAERSGTLASGWAVKDSFRNLDLRPMGLRPLFEAEWIYRPADLLLPSPHIRDVAWRRIAEPGELATWEAAWRGGETEDTVDSRTAHLSSEPDGENGHRYRRRIPRQHHRRRGHRQPHRRCRRHLQPVFVNA